MPFDKPIKSNGHLVIAGESVSEGAVAKISGKEASVSQERLGL